MKMECLSMDVVRGTCSRQDVMNNEWSRFESYKTFPADSVVRPLRLARAGFYYTGSGEEVVCFCCGVKNDVWTEDEAVLDVHRRLSRNCKYICGESTANVAINGDNRLEPVPNSTKSIEFPTEHTKSRSETQFKHEKFEETRLGNYSPCTQTAENSTEKYEEERNVCDSDKPAQHDTSKARHMHKGKKYDMKEKNSSTLTNGQIEFYPRIYDSRPKHTDYSTFKERLASFAHCSELVMDPTSLAKAGFYSAGTNDCARCFFCGGGMKNWQYGDSPWIEHARWFHDCAYVRLCKGEIFVNTVCAAMDTDHVIIYDKELKLSQENIPDDWLIENLNSAAAKLVLSMGYKQEDVEKGVLFARQKYGAAEIRAQYIMEYMQEANKESSTQQLSASGKKQPDQRYSEEEKDQSSNDQGLKVQKSKGSSKPKSEKQRLYDENRKLKDLMTCKICLDNDACVAFLPCGHLASCVECSKSLRKCAICRTDIQATVRVYQA